MIVDDAVPCDPDSGLPAFSVCHCGKEPVLWPLLVVKAVAKLNKTYEKSQTVPTAEMLRDLTGAPTHSYDLQNKSGGPDVFAKMIEGFDLGFVMTVSCAGLREDEI